MCYVFMGREAPGGSSPPWLFKVPAYSIHIHAMALLAWPKVYGLAHGEAGKRAYLSQKRAKWLIKGHFALDKKQEFVG
mgnify:CR=1 FL=1